ncbi:PQQ-binding-like beta-propeller repeat protein [Rhodococcus sp. 077-4]|uniref:outer membrane protein assembly factor BamB family protein n=1 Tax=Rhodococcus sp. 077-4 TaxID=2789271 RepID=UPI0039F5FE18
MSARWPVWLAGTAAMVAVVAAVIVVQDDPTPVVATAPASTTTGTPTVPRAPEVQWSRSAEDVYGREFAQFRDPGVGNQFDSSAATFIDAGDVYITSVGLPDPSNSNFDAPAMVGLDATDGSTVWRRDDIRVDSCADRLFLGDVVCVSGVESQESESTIVLVNAMTGEVDSVRAPQRVLAVGTDGSSVYTVNSTVTPQGYEGTPQLRKGSVDDLGREWVSEFPGVALYAGSQGPAITLDGAYGLGRFGSTAIGFDSATGAITWNRGYPDSCVQQPYRVKPALVIMTEMVCSQSEAFTGTAAVASDGRVVARSSTPIYPYPEIDAPADLSLPMIVGDTAFDRSTGAFAWSSPLLASSNGVAVVGDVVIVRGSGTALVTALDLKTGAIRWENDPDDYYPITAYADGLAYSTVGGVVESIALDDGSTRRRIEIEPTPDPHASNRYLGSRVTESGDRLVYSSTATLAVMDR